MKTFISNSSEQTEQIASEFAQTLFQGDIVAVYGELGAGKTVFARGILKGLNYSGYVTSPTYIVVNEYVISTNPANIRKVVHFDMYRIETEADLDSTGFYDYCQQQAVVLIEWGDRVEYLLDENTKRVYIEGSGDDARTITIVSGKMNDIVSS